MSWTETATIAFLIWLAIEFVILAYLWVLNVSFNRRLKTEHPLKFYELGQPSVFPVFRFTSTFPWNASSDDSKALVSHFFWKRQYLALHNLELTRIGEKMRSIGIFGIAFFVIGVIFFFANVGLVLIRQH